VVYSKPSEMLGLRYVIRKFSRRGRMVAGDFLFLKESNSNIFLLQFTHHDAYLDHSALEFRSMCLTRLIQLVH
jgi:hypothetical protein